MRRPSFATDANGVVPLPPYLGGGACGWFEPPCAAELGEDRSAACLR